MINKLNQYGCGICSLCNAKGKNKSTCPFNKSNLEFNYLLKMKINIIDKTSERIMKSWDNHNNINIDGLSLEEVRNKYNESRKKILKDSEKKNQNIVIMNKN